MKLTLLPLSACVFLAAVFVMEFAASTQSPSPQGNLQGKRVAILAADGFEQAELLEPKKALEAAGARTSIVSPESGAVQGWNVIRWGKSLSVDVALPFARADQFDALLVPGGVVMGPDKLRMNPEAVKFIRAFVDAGKPVVGISHATRTLVETEPVLGRKFASWPWKTEIWTYQEFVVDKGLITSREPADIQTVNREMIRAFAQSGK